jgi:hypothetical protein
MCEESAALLEHLLLPMGRNARANRLAGSLQPTPAELIS